MIHHTIQHFNLYCSQQKQNNVHIPQFSPEQHRHSEDEEYCWEEDLQMIQAEGLGVLQDQ